MDNTAATLSLNYRCNLCDVQFECLSGVTLINLIILLRKHLKETHSEMAKQGEYIFDVATFKLNEFKHKLDWPWPANNGDNVRTNVFFM